MPLAEGIHPTNEKVEAIKNTPSPMNMKELREFLGLINYYESIILHLQGIYRSFIYHISSLEVEENRLGRPFMKIVVKKSR